MIKKLSGRDIDAIYSIINLAAEAYRGVIPDDRYHEPYMTKEELQKEVNSMSFFGWEEERRLVGVMGFQPVRNVTLIRHAYVLPDRQGRGIGTRLLDHLQQITNTKQLLVGTWADATWAIEFYQKQGFRLMPDKDELLMRYWDIPQRQIETSVVLGIKQ
ncbi:MAG: GNAT family N-acetyltransferase [Dehalococcoidia bacterium]|nr:GNAT family N-acetyltransferase [Dehalococcoidia bacterium]